jgi:hypothetical protein
MKKCIYNAMQEYSDQQTKELKEQLAIEKMNSENSKDSYNVIIHELQEQLAEKTEALENSENGMLNLIKYKNDLVKQLEQKELELKAAYHVLTKEEIEQLADEYVMQPKYDDKGHKGSFIKGYTQCQEDMANKKYTEEDLRNAIREGRNSDKTFINSLNKQD